MIIIIINAMEAKKAIRKIFISLFFQRKFLNLEPSAFFSHSFIFYIFCFFLKYYFIFYYHIRFYYISIFYIIGT